MRIERILGIVLMTAASAAALSVPAISAPLQIDAGLSTEAPTMTQKVWCRYGCGDGVGLGGLVGGLVGGAIIAGAAANAAAEQNAAAAAAQQHVAACAQRYRSYDPASNSFQGKDGRRYPCQ
jgi:BA14K-like protein